MHRNIFIVGPRMILPSVPKIFVYSEEGDPAEMLRFNAANKDEDPDLGVEETAYCEMVEGISKFYECTMDYKTGVSTNTVHFKVFYYLTFPFLSLQYIFERKIYRLQSPEGGSIDPKTFNPNITISTFDTQFATMIQTDKPRYKPGDIVRMRIFFIHFNGKAVNDTEIRNFHVEIRNNYDEVVHAFSERHFQPKVYTHTYKIGHEPFEGIYKIHVWTNVPDDDSNDENMSEEYARDSELNVLEEDSLDPKSSEEGEELAFEDDDIFDKIVKDPQETKRKFVFRKKLDIAKSITQSFNVKKYLPIDFTLNVDTKRLVKPRSIINLNISGEYSFGRSTVGTLNLFLKVKHKSKTIRQYHKEFRLDAAYKIIRIDMVKDLNLKRSKSKLDIEVTVQFIDDLSQRRLVKQMKVTAAKKDALELVLEPVDEFLKPGENLKVRAYLRDVDDGTLIESTGNSVSMMADYNYKPIYCDANTSNLMYTDTKFIGSKSISGYSTTFVVNVPLNVTSVELMASHRKSIKILNMTTLNGSSQSALSGNLLRILPDKHM